MPTARVVISQGDTLYRCLRFESSLDGSLLVFLDRDKRPKLGAMRSDRNGNFVPETSTSEVPLPSARYSVHTTGEIHRYSAGRRQSTIYIEPLYALTKPHLFAVISVPKARMLDPFIEEHHKCDTRIIIDLESFQERFTLALHMCPHPPSAVDIQGVLINYEIYSALISFCQPPFDISAAMSEYFFTGMPERGEFDGRQVGKAEAEIAFFETAHPNIPPIFREPGGVYVVFASVPMARPPDLIVRFSRPDLSAEIIQPAAGARPTHKVRFWINDRGGRNKLDELRMHILEVILDAEL